MEMIQGSSLLTYIKNLPNKKIEEKGCKKLFLQLMQGVDYLHSKNIFHRDIKLENVIIDDKMNIKIIDFGFSCISAKSKLLNFFCGTPSYMPPEIIQKKEYIGPYVDIWSSGILLYTLLFGFFPFKGK
jgi:serine/threonine protein kinase